jgi:YD repeat-containing protein
MPIKSKFRAFLTLFMVAGVLFSMTNANAAVATYTYDELDRLTRVDYDDGTAIIYVYDQIGNRLYTYTNPKANFTASPISGYGPLIVNFTDNSTGNPISWAWTFGDGGSSSQQNPSYVFRSAGTYSVSLTASNPAGTNTITKTSYINVQVCPNLPVRIAGKATYSTLQGAYDGAAEGDVIQVQARDFLESLSAGSSKSVTIDGGYTCDYSSNPSMTNMSGAPRISAGTVKMKNIHIRQ